MEEWIASLLLCRLRVLRIQTRLILEWDRLSTTEGARAGVQAFVDAFLTDEPRRMMTAFVNRKEKRRKRR